MSFICKEDAERFLQVLVGKSLSGAFKSCDMELYVFGFGNEVKFINFRGEEATANELALHVLCRFKIMNRVEKRARNYYEDTSAEKFRENIDKLIGLQVTRVGLSEKNDLWLDIGDYWVVFATWDDQDEAEYEDAANRESWRFFSRVEKDSPHLVASSTGVELVHD